MHEALPTVISEPDLEHRHDATFLFIAYDSAKLIPGNQVSHYRCLIRNV